MRYKMSLSVDTRYKSKRGYAVRLQVNSQGQQIFISTGHYSSTKKLKETSDLVGRLKVYEGRGKYADSNGMDWENAIETIRNGAPEHQGFDKAERIKVLEKELNRLKNIRDQPLIPFVETIISEKQVVGMSTKHFSELIRELQKFNPDLDLNDITYAKLKEYEHYKRQNTQGRGIMIQKTLRTLRTVYNEAKHRELIHDLSRDPWDGLKVVIATNGKEKPTLGAPELKRLRSRQGNKVIDLFILQIYVGGQDLIDMADMKWEDTRNDRILIRRSKLRNRGGGRLVDNILLPEAQAIIKRWGSPDTERVFGSWLSEGGSGRYDQQRRQHGKVLRRIGKEIGVEGLGTKSPRTIFRTAGGKLGVNEILLNQIMGHKPSGVSHRYQQNLSKEAQDEAHRKIIDSIFNPPPLLDPVPEGFSMVSLKKHF